MTFPPKPNPAYDYVSFQSGSPSDPLPADKLAADLAGHKSSIDALIEFAKLVQRSDGLLKNASVHPDALSAAVVAMIAGWMPRGDWVTATAYAVKDMVTQSNAHYVCVVAHTSGTFNTDLAAGKWQLASAPSSGSNVSNTPAGGISSTNVQAAIDELDAEKQPLDATLTALAAVLTAANKLVYATGSDTFATTDLTAFGRTLIAVADAAAALAALGAVSKAGDSMSGALLLSGDPSAALHATPKQYVDAVVTGFGATGVRQTVTAGPVSSTTGLPSLLPATATGLTLGTSGVSSTAPFVCTAAQGWSGTNGRSLDLVGYSIVDLSWTGLTNTTTNYLYVVVGTTGTVTPGSTTLAPVYQWGGVPSTTNGQFTFNIATMRGYLGNGSAANPVYLVFVGEAVTSGGNVTSTVTYAYNGRYDSGWTATLPAGLTPVSKNHNTGVTPQHVDFIVRCNSTDSGYAVGDEVGMGSLYTNDSVNPYSVPTLHRARLTAGVITGVTGPWQAFNKSSGATVILTAAKWDYKFITRRGW